MKLTRERAFIWCGPGFAVLFGIGMLTARWLIPPRASENAQQIAAMYRDHTGSIRAGIFIAILGATLFAPFSVAISAQLQRIEGESLYSTMQRMLGGLLVLEVIIPLMTMAVAALRPGRPDSEIQSLNDEGWLLFVGLVTTFSLEMLVTALAVLSDRRETPLFPRWYGWLNCVTAVLIGMGGLDIFATTGVFAWNGLFPWYGGIVAFGSWIVSTTVLLLRLAAQQEREGAPVDEVAALRAEVAALRAEVSAVR